MHTSLFQVERHIVIEHLVDDPDELSGTMSKGIVMAAALSDLPVVISLESIVVPHCVVGSVDQGIPKSTGPALRHTSSFSLKVAGLVDFRVKTSKGKKLVRVRETVNVADLTQDHATVDVSDADIRIAADTPLIFGYSFKNANDGQGYPLAIDGLDGVYGGCLVASGYMYPADGDQWGLVDGYNLIIMASVQKLSSPFPALGIKVI